MFNWSSARDVLRFESDYIQSSSFLFKEQLDKVEELCNKFDTELNNKVQTNKVISIVGERGTGKSTFLNVLDTFLKSKEYLVLDKVDPSIFDDSISIMELFIARVHEAVTESSKSNPYDIKDSQTVNIIKKLNEITKLLISLKNKDIFYKENSTTDVIQDILGKVDFTKKVQELVKDTLTLMNTSNKRYKNIVMIVDDLDLVNNSTTYQMLDYIQKYLANNIIVIVAYRNKQLFNAVVSETINDNRDLVSQECVNRTELELQASRFIEKLLPINSRVHLFSGEELLKQDIMKVLRPFITSQDTVKTMVETIISQTTLKQYKDSGSLKSFLDGLIYNRTRIKLFPYDSTELNSLVIPSNLRGILFMLEYFIETEDPSASHSIDYLKSRLEKFLYKYGIEFDLDFISDCLESNKSNNKRILASLIISENVLKYKTFLRMKINESLNVESISFLEEWCERPVEVRNHYSVNYMLGKNSPTSYQRRGSDVELEINRLKKKKSNNVTIGDVWEAFEIVKDSNRDTETIILIYAIKQLYSVELVLNYFLFTLNTLLVNVFHENKLDSIAQDYFDNYSKIIMRTFLPDTFEVYESQTDKDLDFVNPVYSNNSGESYDLEKITKLIEKARKQDKNIISVEKCSEMIYRFISKVSYLNVPSKGHIYFAAQGFEVKRLSNYRYRDLYYLGNNIHDIMRSGTIYRADPFTYFTSKSYLDESVLGNNYVFLSIYDIDVFFVKNYYRVKEGRFEYLLRSINRVISDKGKKVPTTLNDHWTGIAPDNGDGRIPFNDDDLYAAALFEKTILSSNSQENKIINIEDILQKGYSFIEHSFVDQMIILGLFFDIGKNKNNPKYSKLFKFYNTNNKKKYVMSNNAKYFNSLLSDESIINSIDEFMDELR